MTFNVNRIDKSAFYGALRSRSSGVFGTSLSSAQVEGMEGILAAFGTHGDGSIKTLAYALATACHETARRMVPVRETLAKSDAQARARLKRYAAKKSKKSAVARYTKPTGKYGHVYYGRGHVQLTWLQNYKRSSADAGCDLVAEPDKMLDPIISARVLIRGLCDGRWNGHRKGISHYLPLSGKDDLRNARRTVNITDKWSLIGGYYRAFLQALEGAALAPTADDTLPQTASSTPEGQGGKHPVDISLPTKPKTNVAPVGVAVIATGGLLASWWDSIADWIEGLF